MIVRLDLRGLTYLLIYLMPSLLRILHMDYFKGFSFCFNPYVKSLA